jgi:hypothetical protein
MPSNPVANSARLDGSGTVGTAAVYAPELVVVTPFPLVLLKVQENGASDSTRLKVCVPPPSPRNVPVIVPVKPEVAGSKKTSDKLSVKPEAQVRHWPLKLMVEKLVMVKSPPLPTEPRVNVAVPEGPVGLVWVNETLNSSPAVKLVACARGMAANKTANRTKLIVIQVVSEDLTDRLLACAVGSDIELPPHLIRLCDLGCSSAIKVPQAMGEKYLSSYGR